MYVYINVCVNIMLTVDRSSILVITPIAISRRSAGVSGHGYTDVRNLWGEGGNKGYGGRGMEVMGV